MGKKRKAYDAIQEEEKRRKFDEPPKANPKSSQFGQTKGSRANNKQRDQLVRGNQSYFLWVVANR
jgi:hypothetical protein